MRRRQEFLGGYIAGDSWLHRLPTLAALAGVCAIGLCSVIFRLTWLNLALAVLVVVCGLSARLPLRKVLAPLSRLWLLIGIMLALNVWLTDAETGARVVSTLMACVLAAGLLTLTNSIAQLLAAFTTLARPLRVIGIEPQRAGLAGALMVRSIPVLANLFTAAGDSARARGLESNLRARTTPVVLRAVSYAQDTGRALAARGIGE